MASSFDHLVGTREHGRRHVEAERFGGLEVDDEHVVGRRLYRQVCGLLTLEDAINVAGCAPVLVDRIDSVRDRDGGGGHRRSQDLRTATELTPQSDNAR